MTTVPHADFGNLLREARRKAGLTQESLAEMAGISSRAISDLERGVNRAPRKDTLDLIARALDLDEGDRRAWEQARKRLSFRVEAGKPSDGSNRHLPEPLSSFVGRESEIADVVELLRRPGTRLLTLTGPGGVGKTRLSLVAADSVAGDYPDGVWFISLASLNDPELVLPTIASILGTSRHGDRSVLALLIEALARLRMLLVVDNVEHVIESAPLIGQLLRACPHLVILATSRTPLRMQGEAEYPVPPLDLPETGDDVHHCELLQAEAVRLFAQRAQAVRPDFRLAEDNMREVAGICQRLDGIPLAIELAAAHLRFLSLRALLRRLERSLPLLTGGAVDLPLRQQTLRNTIAWSYDLLPQESRQLFVRLSVFRGGWTLESSEAVIGEENVLDQIGRLVEHSLVRVRELPDGESRYSMLETIREFGLERLTTDQVEHEAHARHAHYFLKLAEDAIPFWRTFEHTAKYGQLETELDNLRAALAWFMEHDGESACRLSGALWRFCGAHGNIGEGRQWMEASLVRHPNLPPAVRARVLEGIGTCAYLMSDYDVMRSCLAEALPLWESVGDLKGIAWCYHGLGRLAYETGDHPLAEHYCNVSLDVSRRAGDMFGIAEAINVLGVIACADGNDDWAQPLYEESLALRREIGDQYGIQQSLSNIGCIAMRAGAYIQARAMFEESLAIGRKHHIERVVEAQELRHLGMLAVLEGDFQQARTLLIKSTTIFRRQGSAFWVAKCLMWFATLAALEQQPTRVAILCGAIQATLEQKKMHISSAEREHYDPVIAETRRGLGDDAWFTAWSLGRTMSLDETIEYAFGDDAAGL